MSDDRIRCPKGTHTLAKLHKDSIEIFTGAPSKGGVHRGRGLVTRDDIDGLEGLEVTAYCGCGHFYVIDAAAYLKGEPTTPVRDSSFTMPGVSRGRKKP